MSVIAVTFPNWDKFNPRSDRANYSWFRLQNGLFHDQAVFGLTDSQKVLYLFLLCEASKTNSGSVSLNVRYITGILGHAELKIRSDIDELSLAGLLQINPAVITPSSSRHEAATEPSSLPATYVRTNVTGLTAKPRGGKPPADTPEGFEEFWQSYPRKIRRTEALKRFRQTVTPDDLASLRIAIRSFRSHLATARTEPNFIPHPSTFLGTKSAPAWRDWLEPNAAPKREHCLTDDELAALNAPHASPDESEAS